MIREQEGEPDIDVNGCQDELAGGTAAARGGFMQPAVKVARHVDSRATRTGAARAGAFSFEATAEHGDATDDYGPAIDKQVEGRTATLKGKVGNGQVIKPAGGRGSISVRDAGRAASCGCEASPTV